MTRLLGFLSGLLLVVALAFAVLRYPPAGLFGDRLAAGMDGADGAVAAATQGEPARESTPAPAEEAGPEPARNPAEQPTREPTQEPTQGSNPEAEPDSLAPLAPTETLPRVDDPPPVPAAEAAAEIEKEARDNATATAARAGGAAPGRQWYAFWQPFHSEISAEGFRRRLEGVTALDYRVLSPRPGEYQVAFAYHDEAERQENLAAIEAATGLVLRSRIL